MYEPRKYITEEQKHKFLMLLETNNPDIIDLKDAIDTLLKQVDVMSEKAYDKTFGDQRLCTCGHTYYRHFDSYEEMSPVGCKYCYGCHTFIDSGKIQRWEDHVKYIEDYNPAK